MGGEITFSPIILRLHISLAFPHIHCTKTLISELQKIKTTRYHTVIDTSPKFQIPYFCVTSESSQQYGVYFTGNIDFMRFYLIQHPKLSFPLETSWTL